VELLVTMAIISLLVALLLPAIQSSREAARRGQCQSHIKQIALALISFHDIYRTFPSGGWGHEWVGDPDQGVGLKQPGGWIYNILPYIEEHDLHDLGFGLTGAAATDLYSQRMQTPIPLLVCPSRRPCAIWPIGPTFDWVRHPKPYGNVATVARADYAINGGTSNLLTYGGPANLAQGNDSEFWAKTGQSAQGFNGISHLRTSVAMKSITDGTANTYLLGEKYLEPVNYDTGASAGDNESLYAGYCSDLHRFSGTIESLKFAKSPYLAPLSDQAIPDATMPTSLCFGSSHPVGFNMAFCDGSVHFVPFDVDLAVHLRSGHRCDNGAPIESLK
jgi:prepilin-type processing-associated H-X9-DG protein